MKETKLFIQTLINSNGFTISSEKQNLFDDFVKIMESEILKQWKIKNRIADIILQKIDLPNATSGKNYTTQIDLEKMDLRDLIINDFVGLEEIGLKYNKENQSIEGIPSKSGEIKIKLHFNIIGELADTLQNEKEILIFVNPDTKLLWKDIPSDTKDLFWKEDDVSIADKLGDRKIVVSSKRGRSHKNVGSFRDDDFSFKHFEKTGWSVVAVSDGAGSYSLSRKGSQLACNSLIEYFESYSEIEKQKEFEDKINEYNISKDVVLHRELEVLAKKILYKATLYVYNRIKEHSEQTYKSNPELFNNPKAKSNLDYYHSTFIFSLFKKYDFGYVILTFGVGDCPIAIMNKEKTETTLLNWLDVGEFGGGTRFITQADIFHSTERPMSTRFNFKIETDFSYLFLMTDGIYDPKFIVESNLEKNEKWNEFLDDLQGKNEDNLKVDFDKSNTEIASQLSNWMDFWSQGNHDDRTLAIIY